ncbi:MAG: ECF transporter S component [Hydrogeniiclostridium sp.]|jgi:uncharacterized membrane protein
MSQKTNMSAKTLKMIQLALLTAIIVLMAFTPVGFIRTPGLEITLIGIPVVVGAVLLGPSGGAILGAVFGLCSFLQCFGMSPFGAVLLGINPFWTFVVCFVPRTLMGWLSALIFKGLRKVDKTRFFSFLAACLGGALLNTILFMSALMLFFGQSEYILSMQGSMNVFAFVLAFVGVNGLIEAIVCAVVGTAISKALYMFLYKDRA